MQRRGVVRGIILGLAAVVLTSAAPVQRGPDPGHVRVRLVTSAGTITVALDARRAPMTTANFMQYVDDGRFSGTYFYRSARRKGNPKSGFIQGGIATDARRILPSVVLEPTSKTGITHLTGTLSMARGPNPNSAHGNFSIMVGDNPGLDARGANLGYAAFGRVIGGMPVVERILGMPTGGGRDEMRGQMILERVEILRAERIDGVARPSGRPKPWLIELPWHRK